MKPFVFGLCASGNHRLCPGTLTRPNNQVATCTCDHHKENHDPDDR